MAFAGRGTDVSSRTNFYRQGRANAALFYSGKAFTPEGYCLAYARMTPIRSPEAALLLRLWLWGHSLNRLIYGDLRTTKCDLPVAAGPALWLPPRQVNNPPPAAGAGCLDYAVLDALAFHRRAVTPAGRERPHLLSLLAPCGLCVRSQVDITQTGPLVSFVGRESVPEGTCVR